MSGTLWENENYLSDIKFINASYIREYDLVKANISALLYMGAITPEKYKSLYIMDKDNREREVGLMIKSDRALSESKSRGIIEAKKMLFEINDIDDLNVLEIRNDAVFVIGDKLRCSKVNDFFDFKLKNEFTSYAYISKKLSIFYRYDPIIQMNTIDIKGIKDNKLELHANYFLSFLCETFYMLQNDTLNNTLKYISEFYRAYINREMPLEYYRTFDAESLYKVSFKNITYSLYTVEPKEIMNLNIDINVYIIRTLYSYISNLYFNQKRR